MSPFCSKPTEGDGVPRNNNYSSYNIISGDGLVLRAAISLLLSTFFHARQLEITGHIVKELCNVLSRGSRLRRGELVYRLTEVRPSLDVVRSSCICAPFFHPPRPLSLCSSSLTRSLLPHPQWSLKRTLDPLRPPICTRSPRQALRRTVRDAVWAPAILARRRRCLRAPPPPPPARIDGCGDSTVHHRQVRAQIGLWLAHIDPGAGVYSSPDGTLRDEPRLRLQRIAKLTPVHPFAVMRPP